MLYKELVTCCQVPRPLQPSIPFPCIRQDATGHPCIQQRQRRTHWRSHRCWRRCCHQHWCCHWHHGWHLSIVKLVFTKLISFGFSCWRLLYFFTPPLTWTKLNERPTKGTWHENSPWSELALWILLYTVFSRKLSIWILHLLAHDQRCSPRSLSFLLLNFGVIITELPMYKAIYRAFKATRLGGGGKLGCPAACWFMTHMVIAGCFQPVPSVPWCSMQFGFVSSIMLDHCPKCLPLCLFVCKIAKMMSMLALSFLFCVGRQNLARFCRLKESLTSLRCNAIAIF